MWIQQLFRQLQSLLHEGKPFAVTILITVIHIIVVVFPIFCPCVVGRIDINAIHLSGIEVFQQLQGMVVVCLDQRVPQVTVRRIADLVDGLEIR